MAIEKAIRSILVSDSDVNDLVSGRIYPYLRQQGQSFPAIVYSLDDSELQHGLVGSLSLIRATISIEQWAETYSGAKALADKVETALDGYTGTSESVVIKSCYHDNSSGNVDISPIGLDRGMSSIESEYVIWYVG
tara:strand:+ start:150 stop:554 length:405 start_codon:yes stop_codon:yes gene_type:complete